MKVELAGEQRLYRLLPYLGDEKEERENVSGHGYGEG